MLALPQEALGVRPDVNPGGAKQRQGAVLQAMVGGSVTQARPTRQPPSRLNGLTRGAVLPRPSFNGANTTRLFLNYLTAYYSPAFHMGDGFEDPAATTHLHHPQPQRISHRRLDGAQRDHVHPGWFLTRAKGGDGALVSLDPQTGAVLAMTGSANYASPGLRSGQPGDR